MLLSICKFWGVLNTVDNDGRKVHVSLQTGYFIISVLSNSLDSHYPKQEVQNSKTYNSYKYHFLNMLSKCLNNMNVSRIILTQGSVTVTTKKIPQHLKVLWNKSQELFPKMLSLNSHLNVHT